MTDTRRMIHRRLESYMPSWFNQLDKIYNDPHKLRQNKPFVTISRQCGAFGTTIADTLLKHLNRRERPRDKTWAIFDDEIITNVLDEHKFPKQYNKYFTESATPTVQDIIGELLGAHPPRETLMRKKSETIFRLAQAGYVILIGRGSNFITRSLPNGVHVRLIDSFEKRLAHMQEYLQVSKNEARDYIIKEDLDRKKYIKKYFFKDINDASLYDIVINLDTVPIKNAVRIIEEMIF